MDGCMHLIFHPNMIISSFCYGNLRYSMLKHGSISFELTITSHTVYSILFQHHLITPETASVVSTKEHLTLAGSFGGPLDQIENT